MATAATQGRQRLEAVTENEGHIERRRPQRELYEPSEPFPYDEIEKALEGEPPEWCGMAALAEAMEEAQISREMEKRLAAALARFLAWMIGPKHPNWDRKFDVEFAKVFTKRGLAALWVLRPDLLGGEGLRQIACKELGDFTRIAHYAAEFKNEFGLRHMRQNAPKTNTKPKSKR